jgi:hypothetical protein
MTGRSRWMGSRALVQLLAVGSAVYITVSRPRRGAEMRASLDTGNAQAIEGGPFIVTGRDNDTGRLDAAAGCEFVDDRIRLQE